MQGHGLSTYFSQAEHSRVRLSQFLFLKYSGGKSNFNGRGFPSIFLLLWGHRNNNIEDRLAQFLTSIVIAKQQALDFCSFLVELLSSVQ